MRNLYILNNPAQTYSHSEGTQTFRNPVFLRIQECCVCNETLWVFFYNALVLEVLQNRLLNSASWTDITNRCLVALFMSVFLSALRGTDQIISKFFSVLILYNSSYFVLCQQSLDYPPAMPPSFCPHSPFKLSFSDFTTASKLTSIFSFFFI